MRGTLPLVTIVALFWFGCMEVDEAPPEDDVDVGTTAAPLTSSLQPEFRQMLAHHAVSLIRINMAQSSYENFNGANAGIYSNTALGRLPFHVQELPAFHSAPLETNQCFQVNVGMFYNVDFGDNGGNAYRFINGRKIWNRGFLAHIGDTESVVFLMCRKDPTGLGAWGASWLSAKANPASWRVMAAYLSAHKDSWIAESSTVMKWGMSGGVCYGSSTEVKTIWAATGKNAQYQSKELCEVGGALEADQCDGVRSTITIDPNRLQDVVTNPWLGRPNGGLYVFGPNDLVNPVSAYQMSCDVPGLKFGDAFVCRDVMLFKPYFGDLRYCKPNGEFCGGTGDPCCDGGTCSYVQDWTEEAGYVGDWYCVGANWGPTCIGQVCGGSQDPCCPGAACSWVDSWTEEEGYSGEWSCVGT